jgi:DNA-binding FrmR family transcriptional regulator
MVNDVPGYSMHSEDYLRRLRLIEGQVRGLARMIDEDTYCIDVLTQVASVTSALRSVGLGLLDEHIRHCVRDAATSEPDRGDKKITEAVSAIERLLKT